MKRGDDYTPAELVIGEPLEKNPSKYEDTKLIYHEESEKAGIYKYGTGERMWAAFCCDGSPLKNFLALFPELWFCKLCKCPAGDPQIHANTFHKGEDFSKLFELEFEHVLPINGSGHTEKIIMQATTQILFKLLGLNQFASWCDFQTDKAKNYLYNFSDHHKGGCNINIWD